MQRQQLQRRRAALVSAHARDPRTAGALFTGNATVAETCEYYGIADAVSRCRKPRSCQDCLATPGCGLTDFGHCRNATSDPGLLTKTLNYRSANFSNVSLISTTSSFVFLAESATYCKAADAVCAKCREQFLADERNGRSANLQFCKGDDGCVCIAICEVPTRRETFTYDWHCGQPYVDTYYSHWPVVRRANRTKARGDPRVPAVLLTPPPKTEESCEYTKAVDLRGCRQPRTCQSCLELQDCTITLGRCYGMKQYSWREDFRTATLDADNMKCDRVGSMSTSFSATAAVAIAAVAWLVFVGTITLWKRTHTRTTTRSQERRRLDGRPPPNLWRNMLDEVPALPVLDLFGWGAYRRELFRLEQELLGGGSPRSLSHPVDFGFIDPSAPDLDEDDASAPTAQDPKALASAPVYRSSFDDRGSSTDGSGSSTHDTDFSSPSAPDFDDAEVAWEPHLSQSERYGLVARRSRREERK